LTEFPLANSGAFARSITAGPDGAMWFTELPGRIGRVATDGSQLTESLIPTRPAEPIQIVTGSDGNLWFTDYYDKIGRVTPAGVLTNFLLPGGVGPRGITSGPDGALWFAETNVGRVGRLTTAGVYTEIQLPDPTGGPFGITTGPDGAIWLTEFSTSKIGRLTTAGAFSEIALPGGSGPWGIAAGSDGNLYVTESSRDRLARVTPAGTVTEYAIPSAGGTPTEIAAGPDGNVWFTEFNGDKIGRFAIQSFCVPDGTTLCLQNARFQVKVDWDVTAQGQSGSGHTIPLTGDTGAFWFFTGNNIELVVKVVDGRQFNGHFWVFIGALSDVEYHVTVRDLQTDHVNAYVNQQGTLQSFADTAAFQ
jgi:streptogramin lyase